MPEHTRLEKMVAEAKKNIKEISPQDAAAKSQSGNAVIVDVREKDEWDEEHIPDAVHMSRGTDRKSTRLNSSHVRISYAVFCLKKKKNEERKKKKQKTNKTTIIKPSETTK